MGWGTPLVGSGSDDLGWFGALEIGKGLVNSANTLGIYGIFTYISFVFDGKCRNLYNTWIVWDMVSVSGQIQPPNTSIQLQMIRHLFRLIQFFFTSLKFETGWISTSSKLFPWWDITVTSYSEGLFRAKKTSRNTWMMCFWNGIGRRWVS